MSPSKELIEETEEYMYSFTSFLAEFGGALGLFLGFSFYSLWDWLEPARAYIQQKRHSKTKSRD